MMLLILTENEQRYIQYFVQVMQLLADSSDDSGSGLNMSDPDVGCNSSASCGRE